jgi:adenylylsulfate kinase-like enzyme
LENLARALHQGHAGRVVWLTGLSCADKTTIAAELERQLFERGKLSYVLDGDNMRHGNLAPDDRRIDTGVLHGENAARLFDRWFLVRQSFCFCSCRLFSPLPPCRD